MGMRLGIVGSALLWHGVALGGSALSEPELAAAAARVDAALQIVLALQSDQTITPRALQTPVAEPIGDAAFLRRLCIDLAGRLPTATEVRAFVIDSSPEKRARAVDRLLREAGAGEWRFQRLAEPLRVTDTVLGVSQSAYVHWLRQALRQDLPYDQLMAQLVGARGTLAENPAAGFLLRDSGHVEITAAELARAFLGEDIHCAGCHDHPFTDHTQRGFYEFAACFNFVRTPAEGAAPGQALELLEAARPLQFPADYMYRDAKPGEEVRPGYLPLFGIPEGDPRGALEARPSPGQLRNDLVLWLTDRQNHHFTSMAALRVWDWMFGLPGRGPDAAQQAGNSDPAPPHLIWEGKGCGQENAFNYGEWLQSHREFVASLRVEFERCGCRIGEFQRLLARTQAYQREALPADAMGVRRFLPAPVIRRLPAEVLWDSIISWLPPDARVDLWRASIDLPQVPPAEHPLRLLGRGTRQWADESRPAISHSLARLMIAAPVIERAVAPDGALLAGALLSKDRTQQVEALFLETLGRFPAETERAATASGETLPDIAWALLNTKEFLFYH